MHDIVVTRGFWFLETPVTQGQWLAVMGGENPSYHRDFPEWRQHPVERVTWPMAKQFCRTLAGRMSVGWRAMWRPDLPTEAQWEYAARAGSQGEYGGGDGEEHLDRVGWYAGNSDGEAQRDGSDDKIPPVPATHPFPMIRIIYRKFRACHTYRVYVSCPYDSQGTCRRLG